VVVNRVQQAAHDQIQHRNAVTNPDTHRIGHPMMLANVARFSDEFVGWFYIRHVQDGQSQQFDKISGLVRICRILLPNRTVD
jgi:hypothetical protein